MSHSYQREGMCRACASVHGCKLWRQRDPQRLLFVAATHNDEIAQAQIDPVVADLREHERKVVVVVVLGSTAHKEVDNKLEICLSSAHVADVVVMQITNEFYGRRLEEFTAMVCGYALALGRRVICVAAGPERRPYHALAQIEHVPTWADVWTQIRSGTVG